MLKFKLLIIGICWSSIIATAQYAPTSGIKKITSSKRSEPGPIQEVPLAESERYKIQLPAIADKGLEYRLLLHEFKNGKYIKNKTSDEVLDYQKVSKGSSITAEYILEVHGGDLFKIFVNTFAYTRIDQKQAGANKSWKYIRYVSPQNTHKDSVSLFLIYEENSGMNDMEKIINKYTKNGLLKNNEQVEKSIRSHVDRYFILSYIFEEK